MVAVRQDQAKVAEEDRVDLGAAEELALALPAEEITGQQEKTK